MSKLENFFKSILYLGDAVPHLFTIPVNDCHSRGSGNLFHIRGQMPAFAGMTGHCVAHLLKWVRGCKIRTLCFFHWQWKY